jgi:sortase A
MVDTQTPPPSSGGGGTFILDFFRTRPWAKRAVSILSAILLIGGVALLAYPFATNLYQNRLQDKLSKQFASQSLKQKYRDRAVGVGDSLTRIKMPAIHVDVVVVEGITPTALRAGAGHYPQTPLPCEKGNVAIAGHRTTYGKPFANLDRLKTGDSIVLETPIGSCTYEVSKPPFTVKPDNLSVVANDPTKRLLTLTTCNPKGSAAQRLVIRASYARGGSVAA